MSVPTIGIIMAGGSGERFWPVSRKQKPKQLLKLTGTSMTLLEEAIERLLPILPADMLYIATNQALQEPLRVRQCSVISRHPPLLDSLQLVRPLSKSPLAIMAVGVGDWGVGVVVAVGVGCRSLRTTGR